jgi:hypothetical protein
MTAAALAAFATCDMIGASALFLVTGSSMPTPGANSASAPPPLSLDSSVSLLRRRSTLYTTQVAAEWTLSDTAVEQIEQIRDGGGLTIYPDFQYALISPGTAMPGWQQPQRPTRVPWPG